MSRIIVAILILSLLAACSVADRPSQASITESLPTSLPKITETLPASISTPITPTSVTPPTDIFSQGVATLDEGSGPVYSLAWSPDGQVFASAGYGEVKIWKPGTSQSLMTLKGHRSFVWGVAWSPDGKMLASASQDGTVQLWETQTYTTAMLLRTGWAFSVAWSPDGKLLAVGTQASNIIIYSLKDGQPQQKLPGMNMVISLAWSPDGKTLAAGYLNGDLILWDTAGWKVSKKITAYSQRRCDVNGLAWSPDGRLLASAHQDSTVRIWSPEGQLVRSLLLGSGWGRGVAWSPDGRWLAAGSESRKVLVWEGETGEVKLSLSESTLPVWSVGWSRDGSRLAAGNGSDEIKNRGQVLLWSFTLK